MRRFRRIVGLGLCALDHLYVVDRFAPGDGRVRYLERRVTAGGMASTAAAQAAVLGCNTHLLSVVGRDAEGERVLRDLRRAGVKTQRLLRSRSLPTSVAVVLVERRGGERRFLVPERRRLETRAPDFDLSLIDARTLLLVDGHFASQARRALRRAREVGATVIGDFHRVDPGVRALLPYVHHPIVPEEFVRAWKDGEARAVLADLARRYGASPVITQGRRGGLYLHRGRVRRYRAQRVRVRDTTGAGDVFHGAFAAGLYHDLEIPDAVALAARAAALCCTELGGQGRLMTRTEMQALLR